MYPWKLKNLSLGIRKHWWIKFSDMPVSFSCLGIGEKNCYKHNKASNELHVDKFNSSDYHLVPCSH